MCELFAMSSRYPTNVSFSLAEFSLHGGITGPHRDGWGIAFHDGYDIRLIREPGSAATSPCIEFIRFHKYRSKIVVSHIRQATVGEVSLRNTQPFSRELGGRMHLFAHNGDLDGICGRDEFALGFYHPVGETDSECAFCHLLQQLQEIWLSDTPPTLAQRFSLIADFAARIRPLGPANFIYSDGEYLFIHGDKRTQPGKQGFHPPGLYWLCRSCIPSSDQEDIPGLSLEYDEPCQRVALAATIPLTDEPWIPMSEGEILIFKDGERIIP